MKLRILSDGTAGGTKIMNAETSELLESVITATWEIKRHQRATITLTVYAEEVDVRGERRG